MSFSRLFTEFKKELPRDQPIWQVNPKQESKEFARSLGLRVPKTHLGPRSLDRMDGFGTLTFLTAFVLKPNNGGNSRGVIPLVLRDNAPRNDYIRIYRSLRDEGARTWRGWLDWVRGIPEPGLGKPPHPDRFRIRGDWLVEELVGAGDYLTNSDIQLPYDWKVYIVDGEVFFITQARQGPRGQKLSYKFWTPDWQDAGHCRPNRKRDPHLPAPMHGEAIVEQALRVYNSLPLESPFVRVDMYEDRVGPVFGEITPRPGGTMVLSPALDRKMGDAWKAWMENHG
jgi:hypothetical protein